MTQGSYVTTQNWNPI